jgi:hypothetical protein
MNKNSFVDHKSFILIQMTLKNKIQTLRIFNRN